MKLTNAVAVGYRHSVIMNDYSACSFLTLEAADDPKGKTQVIADSFSRPCIKDEAQARLIASTWKNHAQYLPAKKNRAQDVFLMVCFMLFLGYCAAGIFFDDFVKGFLPRLVLVVIFALPWVPGYFFMGGMAQEVAWEKDIYGWNSQGMFTNVTVESIIVKKDKRMYTWSPNGMNLMTRQTFGKPLNDDVPVDKVYNFKYNLN